MFLTLAQPMLGAYFHDVQELHGKLAVGGYACFEDIFLDWMAAVMDFVPMTSALRGPNKICGDARIKLKSLE
jgi:hypothetical protein